MNTKPSYAIIGAGKAGLGLAMAAEDAGLDIRLLWNRPGARAEAAKEFLGERVVTSDLGSVDLSQVQRVVVATSDAAIEPVAKILRANPSLPSQSCFIHLSGTLPAEVMGPGRVASLHPLCALPDVTESRARLRNTWFGIEGTAEGEAIELAEALSGRWGIIATKDKPLYHALAVMASNLAVGLFGAVETACLRGNLSASLRLPLLDLMIGALEPLHTTPTPRVLTGPIARGDIETVQSNLRALDDEARPVYAALSRAALRLVDHPRELKADIERILIAAENLTDTTRRDT